MARAAPRLIGTKLKRHFKRTPFTPFHNGRRRRHSRLGNGNGRELGELRRLGSARASRARNLISGTDATGADRRQPSTRSAAQRRRLSLVCLVRALRIGLKSKRERAQERPWNLKPRLALGARKVPTSAQPSGSKASARDPINWKHPLGSDLRLQHKQVERKLSAVGAVSGSPWASQPGRRTTSCWRRHQTRPSACSYAPDCCSSSIIRKRDISISRPAAIFAHK